MPRKSFATQAVVSGVFAGAAILMSGFAAYAASPLGQWARADGISRVKISNCGNKICATNTWVRPDIEKEKVGDVLEMSISPKGVDGYSGSAFDPQRNMTFSMTLKLKDDRMTTSGCVLGGILCRSVMWRKVD